MGLCVCVCEDMFVFHIATYTAGLYGIDTGHSLFVLDREKHTEVNRLMVMLTQ